MKFHFLLVLKFISIFNAALYDNLLNQFNDLKAQLDGKNEEIVELENQKKIQVQRNCEFKKEISSLKQKVTDAERGLLKKEEEIGKWKQKAENTEKQLEQKTKEIEKLKQRINQKNMIPNNANSQEAGKINILDTNQIKGYEKVKELGHGANGTVHEVMKKELYVFKELNNLNTDSFRNLLKEYEVLNQLHHPNIIRTHGIYFGDETTPPTLVLEHCTQNIGAAINSKSLSGPQIVSSIYQIAEGMKYIHFKKLIHRDLKPSNIVIANDGTIKICDFGLCKVFDSNSVQESMTKGIGTLFFMAPEIINEEEYDEKVDVYSFGVLVFFILSGGQMPKIKIKEICNGNKALIPKEINKFSNELINSCWNFDPKERPSFEEICKMLEEGNYQLLDLNEESKEETIDLIKKHKKLIPFYSH